MSMEFYHHGVHEISEGPYGYIILGLVYDWDNEEKCLRIKKVELVEIDMKLGYPIGTALYEDRYEHPFADIYEENGKYYYKGQPVLNYKMLNIPETLTGIEEEEGGFDHHVKRRFYNSDGPLKYSVNPLCMGHGVFEKVYRELYACMLSFDEETLTGTAVGFDALGKLQSFKYKNEYSIEELYEKMISPYNLRYSKPEDEDYARGLEFSFLNFSYETDESGNKIYHYESIWE